MKRILLFTFILWSGCLALIGLQASASASVPPPVLQSPSSSYTYITEDTTPSFIFQAAEALNIEILQGTQVIGSSPGLGDQLVSVTITTPLAPGLHELSYRSKVADTSDVSTAGSFYVLVTSSPLHLSDIAVASSMLNVDSLRELLGRIQPIHASVDQQINTEFSWYNIIRNESDDSLTFTIGAYDEYGHPVMDLSNENFDLHIGEASYSNSLGTIVQAAEGVYTFLLTPDSPIWGEVGLSINNISLGTQYIEEPEVEVPPVTIANIPHINRNVMVGDEFVLPNTVVAVMSDGSIVDVHVEWDDYNVDTSETGTFPFTGTTLTNSMHTVELVLTVTADGDFRIVLTWDQHPEDLDSHLYGSIPAGEFHIFYGQKTYTVGEATYAKLELDDTDGEGPETTTIYVTDDVGAFRFGVHHFSDTPSLAESNATVTLYRGDNLLQIFSVPTTDTTARYWNVFQIVDGELVTEITYPNADSLNRLESTRNDTYEADIVHAIGAIHMLIADGYTIDEAEAVWDIVNNFQTTNGLTIEQMRYHIVNYHLLEAIVLS